MSNKLAVKRNDRFAVKSMKEGVIMFVMFVLMVFLYVFKFSAQCRSKTFSRHSKINLLRSTSLGVAEHFCCDI